MTDVAVMGRPPQALPAGLDIENTPDGVTITRRWLRGKHFLFLLIIGGASSWVISQWRSGAEANAVLIIASLFCVSWSINLLAMFVNSTRIICGSERIDVKHGPLPSVFGLPKSVMLSEVEQLYSATHGSQFATYVKTKSGEKRLLVAPLVSREQALFVEQELERATGLEDAPIEGELPRGEVPPRGAGLAAGAVLIPLAVAGILILFMNVATAEASGSLKGDLALQGFSFQVSDCTSGQREGFGGVTLTSADKAEVRVVKDPVRGQLLVVARPGSKNVILDGSGCSAFELDAHRTNTVVNEIWLMDGSLRVDCPDLRGEAQFEGCQ